MNYPEGTKKGTVTSIKKQLNKIKGWSRDGSAKKYTNKVCRDDVSHPLYIPTLAFLIHFWFYKVSLLHRYTVFIFHSCKHAPHIIILCVCTATQKASVGMYSVCDTLSLQTLFVYFLALPFLFILQFYSIVFYTCLTYCSFLVPSG